MNKVQIFNNEEFGQVRTLVINDEAWFVGKDVATALGYKDTSDALKRHVNTDDKLTRCFTDSGQKRNMITINESGLYALIFSSKLESAQRFKHWVTSEVLPTIRKTGGYVHNDELFINTYIPFADDNTKALFSGVLSTMRQQNEIIKQQQETIEQKEQENLTLQSDNASLAGEILTWSDRSKLNFGIRKLSKITGVYYSQLWNELYQQLKYKYSIDVKARTNKNFIQTIKENEWKYVSISFSAICENYKQSPSKMLKED